MDGPKQSRLSGDRAITSTSDDRLGFTSAAHKIAKSIMDIADGEGFVAGLEGKWGSGKSSLLFLVERELESLPDNVRPTVINFKPWLIGNRDGLLAYLFTELNKALAAYEHEQGDASRITANRAKEAGKALRKFGAGIGQVGGLVQVVGDASGFAPIKWIGMGLSKLKGIDSKREPQLDALKTRLTDALKNLDHKFVITIDDVDRLDPDEVIEVLRLARSVADLPNVTYILCYDRDILARAIERSAKVESGKAYLEKIVQLNVMVPMPETFQLRNWFADEVAALFEIPETVRERFRAVIDYEGGRRLNTPRSVKRALDSIRFALPALKNDDVDIADLTWLLLIKDGDPELYRWIEDYCGTAAAISLGVGQVGDHENKQQLKRLMETDVGEALSDIMYRHHFCEVLPGMEIDYGEDGPPCKIFQRVTDQERNQRIAERRLASPDHYRLYFAFGLPAHSLTQDDYNEFWNAADSDGGAVSNVLLDWHKNLVSGGLSKTDLLLERVISHGPDALSARRSENVLMGFAEAMDEANRIRPFSGLQFNTIWDRAEKLFKPLFERLPQRNRKTFLKNMFGNGAALGWLTSLLRRETFAHGRYGSGKKQEYEWYLSDPEYDEVASLMLKRYETMSVEAIFATPRPISLLFAWRQLGDEKGPRALLAPRLRSDDGFLDIMENLATIHSSSDRGEYAALTKDNLAPFVNYDDSKARLQRLAKRKGELGERAKQMVQAIEDAR